MLKRRGSRSVIGKHGRFLLPLGQCVFFRSVSEYRRERDGRSDESEGLSKRSAPPFYNLRVILAQAISSRRKGESASGQVLDRRTLDVHPTGVADPEEVRVESRGLGRVRARVSSLVRRIQRQHQHNGDYGK